MTYFNLSYKTPKCSKRLIGVVALSFVAMTQAQEGPKNQYPTLTRVEYVQDCIRSYPNVSAREMTYKCSCAIDAIANEITHEEFVDLSTVTSAISIAGERGAAIREQKGSRPMANKFRDLQGKAKKACFIND